MKNTRLTRTAPALLLATLTLITACGDDEEANPPATSAAVPNTPPATILPPATTTPPTTTAPTSAPSTSTNPPTPTTDPVDVEAAKQAVIAAAENAWRVFNEVKLDPTNDAKVRAALAAHEGNAKIQIQVVIDEYRAAGRRSVTSDVVPARIDLDPASVVLYEDGSHATIEFCRIGSNVLVESAGNPDGTDLVLDDAVNAYWERETYILENGTWLNSDVELLAKYEGQDSCAPLG